MKSYEITVHSIKGSSFGICADAVGRLAADLERAAKELDFAYIKKHNGPFISIARKLVFDIDELLTSIEADSQKQEMDKPDAEVLERLSAACAAYDMDGVVAAMDELLVYRYESGGDLVDWLRENVDLMNFDEIVERIDNPA